MDLKKANEFFITVEIYRCPWYNEVNINYPEALMELGEKLRTARYATREWNYGFCEDGALIKKKRIEGCGTVEAHILLKNDLITGITFRGDYFSTLPPEELAAKFIGLPLNKGALTVALETCRAEDYITGLDNAELISLLCE